MALVEGLLHRIPLAVLGEALDRRDLAAVGLHSEDRAALHGLAVEVDGAGAAVGGVAADRRSGAPEPVTQVVDQEEPRLDVVLVTDAVDRRSDAGHRSSRR